MKKIISKYLLILPLTLVGCGGGGDAQESTPDTKPLNPAGTDANPALISYQIENSIIPHGVYQVPIRAGDTVTLYMEMSDSDYHRCTNGLSLWSVSTSSFRSSSCRNKSSITINSAIDDNAFVKFGLGVAGKFVAIKNEIQKDYIVPDIKKSEIDRLLISDPVLVLDDGYVTVSEGSISVNGTVYTEGSAAVNKFDIVNFIVTSPNEQNTSKSIYITTPTAEDNWKITSKFTSETIIHAGTSYNEDEVGYIDLVTTGDNSSYTVPLRDEFRMDLANHTFHYKTLEGISLGTVQPTQSGLYILKSNREGIWSLSSNKRMLRAYGDCVDGKILDNGSCISPEKPVEPECNEGETLVDGVCVVTEPPVTPECNEGETLVDGVCVVTEPPVTPECNEGETLVDGVCLERGTRYEVTSNFESARGQIEIDSADNFVWNRTEGKPPVGISYNNLSGVELRDVAFELSMLVKHYGFIDMSLSCPYLDGDILLTHKVSGSYWNEISQSSRFYTTGSRSESYDNWDGVKNALGDCVFQEHSKVINDNTREKATGVILSTSNLIESNPYNAGLGDDYKLSGSVYIRH